MSTRKAFLAAGASSALIAAAPPSAQPSGTPSPSPKPSKVSQAARALAESMRKFDPQLSERDLGTIAQNIDGNLKLGASIDPKGRALKNWNEPVPSFEAAE